MNGRKFLLVTIALLVLAGLSTVYVRPAYALPVYLVNLDANSINQTDLLLQTTFSPTHGFRVGALVNASSANPLLNVQASSSPFTITPLPSLLRAILMLLRYLGIQRRCTWMVPRTPCSSGLTPTS